MSKILVDASNSLFEIHEQLDTIWKMLQGQNDKAASEVKSGMDCIEYAMNELDEVLGLNE